ncbi:MAG: TonB-dependent receptor [Nitrospira sp.]|nr:TonB-dependent receptor [Nitrospira sp.]
MYMRMLCMILLSLFISVNTYAAEVEKKQEDKKAYAMEEIVVTESKIPQTEENITQKIDVITQEEIERTNYNNRNISEMFLYQPGTFISVLSRNDANWGSYGGLGPKYNVYLLDGLPIDSFVDTMSLDPWILERAEVHRGPASVMYPNYLNMDFAGNEAPLAGITNLILKDKIEIPQTRIQLGYGSWNTLNAKLYNQGSKGDFHYFIGANYEQSDYTDYGTDPSWLNMIDNPEYKKTKLYFKTTYFIEPDKQSVSLFANHTQHTGDAGRPNRGFDHIYDTINAAYKNQIDDAWNLQLKVGYRYYNRSWEEDNFPDLSLREKDAVKQNIIPADLAVNFKHLGKSVLTFGTDFQYADYKTTAEVDGEKSTGNKVDAMSAGVYVQEKFVYDKWVFRAGGRYSYTKHEYDLIGGTEPADENKSWDKFLWSAGMRYNAMPSLAFFANAGKSYLIPSAKSVGGTLSPDDIGVPGMNGQLPNPNLNPESGIGYDIGTEITPIENLYVGIRGFYNVVDDAIVENRVSEDPSQSQSVNAGKAKSIGAEIEIKQWLNKYVSWFANYTYTHTKIENDVDPDQDGSEVTFVPNSVANLGITANLPYDITVSPYLHAVGKYYDSTSKSGRQKFGPYEIVNIKAGMALLKTKAYQANLNVDLNNVTDKKFEMPWQFQDPGFNAHASIEIVF